MKRLSSGSVLAASCLALAAAGPVAAQCPPDAVRVGPVCVDRYEASVWRIPVTLPNAANLIAAVQAGMITSAMQMSGAQRRGETGDDYGNCTDDGAGACTKVYAVSIPGVQPSQYLTWFQALAACTNSGKRLLSNQEWTAAALGSPDTAGDNGTTDCNTAMPMVIVNNGSRSSCVSSRGAFDMVGNVFEWVADWVPRATTCGTWSPTVTTTDAQCIAGAAATGEPGAVMRGGGAGLGSFSGPLAVVAGNGPSTSSIGLGFRCGR